MKNDDDFDLRLAEALKKAGMARSADAKKDLLSLGRIYCRRAALNREDRTATADDAARGFKNAGFPVNCLGNASGSLFSEKGWTKTGEWRKSLRITNHAHENRVWKLL